MQRIDYIEDRETESQLGGREVPRGWQEATVTSRLERKGEEEGRHWSPGARFWQNQTTERRGVGATEGRWPLPEKPPRQKGQRTDTQILHHPGSHQSLLLAQTRGACTCSLRGGQLPTHTQLWFQKRCERKQAQDGRDSHSQYFTWAPESHSSLPRAPQGGKERKYWGSSSFNLTAVGVTDPSSEHRQRPQRQTCVGVIKPLAKTYSTPPAIQSSELHGSCGLDFKPSNVQAEGTWNLTTLDPWIPATQPQPKPWQTSSVQPS